VTVLARRIGGRVRVYPRLLCIQTLYLTFRKVTQGNGSVDESRRIDTGVKGVLARSRSSGVREKVDALIIAVLVRSWWDISQNTGSLQIIVGNYDDEVQL
jgi:hypothetical protein